MSIQPVFSENTVIKSNQNLSKNKLNNLNNVKEPGVRIGKPKWLRVKLPTGKKYTELRAVSYTHLTLPTKA